MRVAVVGVSATSTCGVRDHAELLAGALADEGASCSWHWLTRADDGLSQARHSFAAWGEQLTDELRGARPDAALLHYSVFSYSHRGVPLFAHRALASIRAAGTPLVPLLHEYEYPWRRGGVRGLAWALTQRIALIEIMRSSAGVVATTPYRAQRLATRVWLPRRAVAFAPVFSTLPPPQAMRASGLDANLVGVFGYAYEGAEMDLVLDALRELRAAVPAVRLQLLGAPGPDSHAAGAWRAGARARGIEDALSFSGVLPAQELSNALACCAVLLHPEPSGPTSRKTTLAGSLASGRPVVALEGPHSWGELLQAQAALVVAPRASALAGGVGALLQDRDRADALGHGGREFAEHEMGLGRSARVVRDALGAVA